ncbi:MAG: hypothetical protein EAZ30_02785 [Betaproteobacteria bacterium]|nr:MAG: hypothetical protein EAZ30_02785 [Betaproteobacteria bacterium]
MTTRRTDNYDRARVGIAEHQLKHDCLPTVAQLEAWMRDVHDATPSRSTLSAALRQFRDSQGDTSNHESADGATLALAKTIQAQADARAAAKLDSHRESVDKAANERIAIAQTDASRQIERAVLEKEDAQKLAEHAAVREQTAINQAQLEISRLVEQVTQLQQTLLATSSENAALRQGAELVNSQAEDARRLLLDANARSDAVLQSLQATLADEREQHKIREARSSEQYAGLNRVLGQQVSDLKTKNEALEKQLLKARQEADATVGSVVRDAINALSDQLNQNASRSEASLAAIDLIAKSMLNEMRAALLNDGTVHETGANRKDAQAGVPRARISQDRSRTTRKEERG